LRLRAYVAGAEAGRRRRARSLGGVIPRPVRAKQLSLARCPRRMELHGRANHDSQCRECKMKINDILQRDPSTHPLVNQGQARIADKANEKVLAELRGELATFVCERQYADRIQRILSAYLSNLTQTSQKAAWVSGFFGSGKSHLLKMLCHLWA